MTHARFRIAALTGAALIAITAARPADAFIVFDPSNYAQNVLTAARALQQINNQITSLQNQAQMLINQARNLASLPFSSLAALQAQIAQTQQLLSQAQRLAYNVAQIQQAFTSGQGAYGAPTSPAESALMARANSRWQTAVAGLEDALKVQASVVGGLSVSKGQMQALVSSSQSAQGALQAAQAGNQLLALQAQQLTDISALLAAQGRAEALGAADQAAARADASARLQRFMTSGQAYSPTTVTMWH